MIITVESEHGDLSTNPRGDCVWFGANTLVKGMNQL